MIHTTETDTTIATLVKDLADESRRLLRQEVELAKAEMSEKASRFARNIAYMIIGGAVLYAGFLALVATACIGIAVALNTSMDSNIAVWLGPLLVGIVIAIIGYAFIQTAIHTFRHESLAPRKTIESLRENREWLRDQMTETGPRR